MSLATHKITEKIKCGSFINLLFATDSMGVLSGYEIVLKEAGHEGLLCERPVALGPYNYFNHQADYQLTKAEEYLNCYESPSFPGRKKEIAEMRKAIERLRERVRKMSFHCCKEIKTEVPEVAKAKEKVNQETEKDGPKIQKIFIMAKNQDGLVIAMDYSLPLIDTAKQSILCAIDDGYMIKQIEQAEHSALVKASEEEKATWPEPTADDLKAIKKLVDWEEPYRKEVYLTDFVPRKFSPEDYQGMGHELRLAKSEKAKTENELKAFKESRKAILTELDATINRITEDMARGSISESVKHKWIMNDPKRNVKSLYRLDRDPIQLVKTAPMLPADKQMTLDDIAAMKAKKERSVEEKEVTEITNEPYDGEILDDKEVAKEQGADA